MPDGWWRTNTQLELMDYPEMMITVYIHNSYTETTDLRNIEFNNSLITGTMSAWFVWSALGLYPLPGTDKYFLGSPAIDAATLHFDSGIYFY